MQLCGVIIRRGRLVLHGTWMRRLGELELEVENTEGAKVKLQL